MTVITQGDDDSYNTGGRWNDDSYSTVEKMTAIVQGTVTAIVQGTVTATVHEDEGNDDSTVLSTSQRDDANYNTEGNDREGTGDDDS